ncbi:hypothetical protein UlMin_039704 [Ulmus minor]
MGQCVSRQEKQKGGGEVEETKENGCLAMVKEKKSRFYIARKCLMMLICWHKYSKY